MRIFTLGDFRKVTQNLSDDFRLEFDIMNELPDAELINSRYPYPWRREDSIVEYHDTGYSDKVVCFGVYKMEE